jgi:uncharacterized protein YdhG (YjbR/CyaY superfamily)
VKDLSAPRIRIKEPMASTTYKSVDDYIAAQPKDAQPVLQQVRRTIRKALPGAVEVISYQVPTYKVNGGYVVYFAGWKEHYSLYPASDKLVAAFKDELTPYRVSKGTLRFPLSEQVPVKLIERVTRFLAGEAAERARNKVKGAKKAR